MIPVIPISARILSFPSKSDVEQVSSATNPGSPDALRAAAQIIEDLECGPWTTRKLRISTSTSGSLIIECFESADGKRLRGSGKLEPAFCLDNLKILVQNGFGFDELPLFPYYDARQSEIDYMSHVVNYPEHGRLIVILSLALSEKTFQCKLRF